MNMKIRLVKKNLFILVLSTTFVFETLSSKLSPETTPSIKDNNFVCSDTSKSIDSISTIAYDQEMINEYGIGYIDISNTISKIVNSKKGEYSILKLYDKSNGRIIDTLKYYSNRDDFKTMFFIKDTNRFFSFNSSYKTPLIIRYYGIENGYIKIFSGYGYGDKWCNLNDIEQPKLLPWKEYYPSYLSNSARIKDAQGKQLSSNIDNINIRKRPDKNSEKLMSLNIDDFYKMEYADSTDDKWMKVKIYKWTSWLDNNKTPDSLVGWVKYLSDYGYPNLSLGGTDYAESHRISYGSTLLRAKSKTIMNFYNSSHKQIGKIDIGLLLESEFKGIKFNTKKDSLRRDFCNCEEIHPFYIGGLKLFSPINGYSRILPSYSSGIYFKLSEIDTNNLAIKNWLDYFKLYLSGDYDSTLGYELIERSTRYLLSKPNDTAKIIAKIPKHNNIVFTGKFIGQWAEVTVDEVVFGTEMWSWFPVKGRKWKGWLKVVDEQGYPFLRMLILGC